MAGETTDVAPVVALAETTNAEPAPGPAAKNASGGTDGMAAGQVKAIDDSSIQMSTDNKELVIEVTGETRMQRLAEGSLGDVQPGQLVTVQGAPAEDGTFTAQSVAIGEGPQDVTLPSDIAPGTPAAGQNDAAGPAGQLGNTITGQVVAVVGDTVQVSPASGMSVPIKVTEQTRVQKMVRIGLSDIQVGEWLSVLGTLGTDGKITARSIEAGGELISGPPPAQ